MQNKISWTTPSTIINPGKIYPYQLIVSDSNCTVSGFNTIGTNCIDPSLGKCNSSKKLIIARGDSLYLISKREGVSVREIIVINKLDAPFTLYPGDQLIIPTTKQHVVEKGENLWNLSNCYGVDISTLRQINFLERKDTIQVGMKLKIPTKVRGADSKCLKRVAKRNIDKGDKRRKKQVKNNYASKYVWPVKGKILTNFGVSSSGLKNDGVNILSEIGKPVVAADSGKVVYSGNEIQAFGNLILIKHNNNETTAYAHLENVKVARGQLVAKGEIIANIGTSGKVSIPQLHFELRDSSGPLNPLKYLPINKSSVN